MLVLQRKTGSKIILGKDIVITVVECDRGRVRLGIQAPRSVSILRDEHVTDDEMTLIAEAAKGGGK